MINYIFNIAFYDTRNFTVLILMPTVLAVLLLLMYGGFCLFIRWLRAWKPVPIAISVIAWLIYALAVMIYAACYFSEDYGTALVYLPFVVITPLCYIAILTYRKHHPETKVAREPLSSETIISWLFFGLLIGIVIFYKI